MNLTRAVNFALGYKGLIYAFSDVANKEECFEFSDAWGVLVQ